MVLYRLCSSLCSNRSPIYEDIPGKIASMMSLFISPFLNLLSVLALFLIAGSPPPPDLSVIEKPVAKGVTFRQEITGGKTPLVVNLLKIEPKTPGVQFRSGQANDVIHNRGELRGRETIGLMAVRNRAIGAINADFFAGTGDPLGLEIIDGELVSEPMNFRACLALLPDHQNQIEMGVMRSVGVLETDKKITLPLAGINRVPQEGEIIVETPRFAGASALHSPGVRVVVSGVNLPLRPSQTLRGTVETVTPLSKNEAMSNCPADKICLIAFGGASDLLIKSLKTRDAVTLGFGLFPTSPLTEKKPIWADAQQAVSGGPWLVKAGVLALDDEAERFNKADFVTARHPRSAFGVTKDGTILLVAVDGRAKWSAGVSLKELAEIMLKHGAINAINLDGGGSTSLFVGGGIVNAPSDGRLRPVADGLLVFADPLDAPELTEDSSTSEPGEFHLEPAPLTDGIPLRINERLTFRVVTARGKPIPASRPVIWGTEDGFGFITQNGVFESYRAGRGTVTARVGGRTLRIGVTISAKN